MPLKEASFKNCGDTVTTPKGTYTFHEGRMLKHEAAKLCEKNGGILAPLNSQEEFDAVHKFAYQCQRFFFYKYKNTRTHFSLLNDKCFLEVKRVLSSSRVITRSLS